MQHLKLHITFLKTSVPIMSLVKFISTTKDSYPSTKAFPFERLMSCLLQVTNSWTYNSRKQLISNILLWDLILLVVLVHYIWVTPMALAPTQFGMMYLFLSGLSCVNVVGLVGTIQLHSLLIRTSTIIFHNAEMRLAFHSECSYLILHHFYETIITTHQK